MDSQVPEHRNAYGKKIVPGNLELIF